MIQTRAVLAASYKGKAAIAGRPTLTHAYVVGRAKTVCQKILAHRLADECATDVDAQPTCLLCRRNDPRNKGEGPRVLKSILHF